MENGNANNPIKIKVILGSALPKQIAQPTKKGTMNPHPLLDVLPGYDAQGVNGNYDQH